MEFREAQIRRMQVISPNTQKNALKPLILGTTTINFDALVNRLSNCGVKATIARDHNLLQLLETIIWNLRVDMQESLSYL